MEITLRNTNDEMLGDVIIYDALGRRVLQRFISGSETRIDVTNLAPGIYFLCSDQFKMMKFIKE